MTSRPPYELRTRLARSGVQTAIVGPRHCDVNPVVGRGKPAGGWLQWLLFGCSAREGATITATVAVIACLDTKGREILYLRGILEAEGVRAHVIDTGVLGEPAFAADTSAEDVARAAGTTLADLRARGDRGESVAKMSEGVRAIVRLLHDRRAIQGAIGAGGSANTTIAASAMRALPVGFPKLIVSTLASGDVSPYVDTKDVAMLHSVVDVAGVNRISARILANAARAIAGMARGGEPPAEQASRPLIAATMFGVTTPCVNAARQVLEDAGFEVLVFHATGTGGRAMEGLIEDGYIAGVLDLTTTELADELVGGILSAGPRRLTVAAAAGVPQVVSVGALDMVNFGPPPSVPAQFAGRLFYQHNPTVTLMRTTPAENRELGRRIAERLANARAPVRILLPLRSVSLIDQEGKPFHDPEADRELFTAIREGAGDGVPIEEMDCDINDGAFARRAAEALISMIRNNPLRGGKD